MHLICLIVMIKFTHSTKNTVLLAFTALVALSGLPASSPAQAQQERMPTLADEGADPGVAMTTKVSDLADQSPIVINGTIGEIRDDEFDLNYGPNSSITVELDRFNWTDNATDYLKTGQKVTIDGFIDDDLFEGREIEAYNMHLHQNSTYYFTDTENATVSDYTSSGVPLEDGAYITVTGTVTDVKPAQFSIITSAGDEFSIDAKDLDPPLRLTEGTYFVAPGDRVNIRGNFDMRYYQNKTVYADRVIKLVDSGINPVIED